MFVASSAILVGLLALSAPPDADLRAGASQLLELAEQRTTAATAAAAAEYEKLKRAAPADARIEYVGAIALLQQRKYATALPLVARYLAQHPDDQAALRTKIWVQLNDRRFDDAFAESVRLSQLAAKAPPEEAGTAARFLGTLYGYFELVRPDAAPAETVAKHRRVVLATLGEAHLAAFDEGRQVVVNSLAQLDEQKQQREEAAAAKRDDEQKQAAQELASQEQTIAASKMTIDTAGGELRDAQQKLAVLRAQLGSLANDRTQLEAQAASLQSQLLEQQKVLSSGRRNLGAEAIATRISVSLAALNKQLFDLDRKALALRNEAAQLGQKGQGESEAIARGETAVRQAEKKSAALERRMRQLAKAKPASTAALSVRRRSLATYLPFPYDDEKERVLAWFAQP
jgi:hypothetical protein